jgi:hypothetical protein
MQTLTSQTVFPINGQTHLQARNGRFRAVVVDRNFYYTNPEGATVMVRQANPRDFIHVNSPMGDQILVVEPEKNQVVVELNGPMVRRMAYNAASQYAMNLKEIWANPTYKYTIIAVVIVLVLLIIWLIWKMYNKKSSSRQTIY